MSCCCRVLLTFENNFPSPLHTAPHSSSSKYRSNKTSDDELLCRRGGPRLGDHTQLLVLANFSPQRIDVLHALFDNEIDNVSARPVILDERRRLLGVDGEARLNHRLSVVRAQFHLGRAGRRRRHRRHVNAARVVLDGGDVVRRAAVGAHAPTQQLGHNNVLIELDVDHCRRRVKTTAVRLERSGLRGGARKAVEDEAKAAAAAAARVRRDAARLGQRRQLLAQRLGLGVGLHGGRAHLERGGLPVDTLGGRRVSLHLHVERLFRTFFVARVGVGEGQVKWSLPDAHTDFIIAVAAEEYGLILVLIIIALYATIVFRSLMRLVRERDVFIRLAGTGLACIFGVQAMINMGVAVRLLPAKGMTLPFVSYGGSSLIAGGIAVGMLLALTRTRPQGEIGDILGRRR